MIVRKRKKPTEHEEEEVFHHQHQQQIIYHDKLEMTETEIGLGLCVSGVCA